MKPIKTKLVPGSIYLIFGRHGEEDICVPVLAGTWDEAMRAYKVFYPSYEIHGMNLVNDEYKDMILVEKE